MRVHYLKILKHNYECVEDGTKTCEIRKNDRAFQKGDIAYLEEIDNVAPDKAAAYTAVTYAHTGRVTKIMITHVSTFMQKEEIVVLSFAKMQFEGLKDAPGTDERPAVRANDGGAGSDSVRKQVDAKNSRKPAAARARKNRGRSNSKRH